ncbi:hypothetical protein [Novosphingobium resinovorum]|uniref:Uncharacterized protein n=1 Tax=Novosphingobium resinovorum TaxID=158500 RepID=A0A1D8A8U1_9SPHN|nr:hypothetical protein [Novosphingobium resinovorum]AOR78533.1 hypothetical protein BES08_06575 [Novosphingobium resinovorum]
MSVQQAAQTMQAWTLALRDIMRYPWFAPMQHTVAFASGGKRDMIEAIHLAGIAEEMGRDVIHVDFDRSISGGPIGVSMVVRQAPMVEWAPNLRLYAASDDAPVELLSIRHRWFIGPHHLLTAGALPPASKIRRGTERAMRRWREAAEDGRDVELPGSIIVPAGQPLANAIPREEFLARAAG